MAIRRRFPLRRVNIDRDVSDKTRMGAMDSQSQVRSPSQAQSQNFDFDLLCLGCGPAGEKAATQAAYFGHRVAIVEQCARPGGAMVNTGTVPSKALRETALLCSAFNRRPIPGTNFRLDRSLSVPRFMAHRLLLEQQEHDRIESSIDRHDISVLFGRGRVIDAHTIEVTAADGKTHRATSRFILIATGSSPLRPSHIPFDQPNVVDADGVLNLPRLPASMIIVGGGVIGCEYASIFAEMGVHITLIHNGDHILPFVDHECRERLVESMIQQDVDFVPNRSVASVKTAGAERVEVTLDDGRTLSAEALLWAAGRCSNTVNLGLEQTGVKMGQRGLVVVDEHYRTNIESIYAAGDVIGFPALAATSMEQGRIAACHMFGLDFKKKLGHIMPIGLYTIPAISMVGLTMDEARTKNVDVVVGRALYRDNVRGRMLGDNSGLLKCLFDRQPPHALLGATIVGEDATELIHQAQMAIAAGLGIEYFISACFNYPSLSELFKYAAYNALQAMKEERRAAA
jgi:NAD(P) transhydrogenase